MLPLADYACGARWEREAPNSKSINQNTNYIIMQFFLYESAGILVASVQEPPEVYDYNIWIDILNYSGASIDQLYIVCTTPAQE